jgi:hypothetical protein
MGKPPVDFRKPESLDEIVSHSAAVLAEQIQAAAAWAKSEMDLQVEVAGALKDFAKRAQITLGGHHNVTVATGRPDSVYGSVIVEYKNPGTLSLTKDAAPNRAVIDQLKQRFYDLRREEKRAWNSMFGVGTDGKYFIFLRFRDDKWTDQEPLEVNRYSAERFLWALYNLGQKGKPYQPEYLHGDFGSESPVAQEGVRALYEEILATDNPKAQVFFSQWKILFGEVCGYDVENLSDKLKKLAEFYVVKGKPQPAPLLFAVHTYYAILIKLLAAEIVSFFNPWMPRQVERLQSATTPAKLRRELQELERGGIFHQMGITNFLEGDLFSWYLDVWSDPVQALVRTMITKLDEYNPGTSSEDPAQSRDLLKKLYQHLFPRSVRHDLGEYYTPDWLAEHVLNELGYEGDPDKRLLDPACGSGTFLVMAINRIRRWYDLNREKCAYDEGDLLRKILANVVGFDLNPLAVMAARTNYLVAIKDLVRHVDHVEIPVYLCDSIMTPAEYGDLFTGGDGAVAKVPCSAMKPPHLLVPKEIAGSPKDVAKYAEILEVSIKNGYGPDEFLGRCRDEGLNITATSAHLDLYREMVALDKANKNGIWARIIKNNFAPLFVGQVDYVAGNPPWITWGTLPDEYRRTVARVWAKHKLFELRGMEARLGGSGDDLSILFLYESADAYLKERGLLGFVITQAIFKNMGGGRGFRRFKLGDGTPLGVVRVDDMVDLNPFEGATNRTAVISVAKGKQTEYPVRYTEWLRKSNVAPLTDITLSQAVAETERRKLLAWPIDTNDPVSPWATGSSNAREILGRLAGRSAYRARKGVSTSANGVFWVRVLQQVEKEAVLIENCFEEGKRDVERFTAKVEKRSVRPYIRGRDVDRWVCSPSTYIILGQDSSAPAKAVTEQSLRRSSPSTYAYFNHFRNLLEARRDYIKFFKPQNAPFYSLYNFGPYTLARWKVLWRYIDTDFRAAVSGPIDDPILGHTIALPDSKVCLIECHDEDEAMFLAAVLNSRYVRMAVRMYTVGTQISTHVTEHVKIPAFSQKDPTHRRLSELGHDSYAAARAGQSDKLERLEATINQTAAKLWKMTGDELEGMHDSLVNTGSLGRTLREDD